MKKTTKVMYITEDGRTFDGVGAKQAAQLHEDRLNKVKTAVAMDKKIMKILGLNLTECIQRAELEHYEDGETLDDTAMQDIYCEMVSLVGNLKNGWADEPDLDDCATFHELPDQMVRVINFVGGRKNFEALIKLATMKEMK